MTTEVSIFEQGTLPAHLQNKEVTNDGMITSGESLPRISIKGMQFRLKSKDAEQALAQIGQALDFVILAVDPPNSNVGKAFFKAGFSGNSEKPDCSSADGIRPDHWIDTPQCTACASCPQAVWGSKINQKGNEVKACSDHKRLLVVNKDNVEGELHVIQVPATSLKNLSGYGRQLNKHHYPLAGVLTRLSFDQASEYPKLCFDAVGFLDEATADTAIARSTGTELQDQLHHASEPPAEQQTAGAEVAKLDAPVAEPAAPVMTTKAGGATYESFIEGGWTEKQILDNGYMEPRV